MTAVSEYSGMMDMAYLLVVGIGLGFVGDGEESDDYGEECDDHF